MWLCGKEKKIQNCIYNIVALGVEQGGRTAGLIYGRPYVSQALYSKRLKKDHFCLETLINYVHLLFAEEHCTHYFILFNCIVVYYSVSLRCGMMVRVAL